MSEPMPLAVAVKRCFPHGGVTKSTLLAAIGAGALDFEKIGNAYFVTDADVEKWRKSCRNVQKARAPICATEKAVIPSTSSAVDRVKSAQDAALMMSRALTDSSPHTLRKHSSRTPGNVTYLASQSQKS
jgi:hypothetical protein